MNYLDAFLDDLRQNPRSDKIDKICKTPGGGNSAEFADFEVREILRERPGARVVSPNGTAWRDLTCPERSALMVARDVPEAWAAGIADLWARTRPPVISESRWHRAQSDGEHLAAALPEGDCWLARLRSAGWSLIELFGIDPEAPDARANRAGLCWQLRGDKIKSVCGNGVAIVETGRRIARPATAEGRELLWRLWA